MQAAVHFNFRGTAIQCFIGISGSFRSRADEMLHKIGCGAKIQAARIFNAAAIATGTSTREKGLPMQKQLTRRRFLAATAVAGVGLTLPRAGGASVEKLALLGGKPVRTEPFPSWPVWDQSEERALLNTVRTGKWFRGSGKNVDSFEAAYADLMGAKFCVGTSSGTSAL